MVKNTDAMLLVAGPQMPYKYTKSISEIIIRLD